MQVDSFEIMWSVLVYLGGMMWASAGASCAHSIDTSREVHSSTSGTVSVKTGYGGNYGTWCPDDTDSSPCLHMVFRYTVKLGYIEIHGEDRGRGTCRVDRLWLGVNGTRIVQLDRVDGTNSFTNHSYPALESSVFQIYTPANSKCCFRFLLKGCIVGCSRQRKRDTKKRKSKEKDEENMKKRKHVHTASGAMADVHAFLRQSAPRRKDKKNEDDSGLDFEAAEELLLTVLESEVNVTDVNVYAGNLTMDVLEAVSRMMSLHTGRHHRLILGADKFLRKLEKELLRDKAELTLKDNNCKFRAERLDRKKSARFQFDKVSVIVPPLESNATDDATYSQVMVAILDSELGAVNESSRITPIVSVNIGAHDSMTSTLDLQFTHVPLDRNRLVPLCVFMTEDPHSSEWSPSGIETTRMTDSSTECKSSHLTSFAIIMQPVKLTMPLTDVAGLEVTSLIGCSVSITALSVTFIMLIGVRRASKRLYILKNLVLMLLLSQTVFLVGIDKTNNELVCKTVAALLHFLFLTCLTWMLTQGVELYFKVSDIFNQKDHSVVYTVTAYLTPLVIVGVSLLKSYHLYGYENYCWLSPDEGLVFAFIGPAVSVFTVNVLVLVLVMVKFNKVKVNAKKTDNQKIKCNIRACVILLPVLGPTWIVGVFAVNSSTVLFQYIFSLLNGLQGMLVLIFHCLLNEDVMTSWKKKFGLRQSKVHTSEVKVTTPTQDAWTGRFPKPKRTVEDIFTVTTSKLKQIS
ncbi:uncharacterized protein [Haliotis asinina]|uniref:uncharacterized protein n=1 Tax=Haliotis asinina TaxID=109174 RepID=UPI003531EB86